MTTEDAGPDSTRTPPRVVVYTQPHCSACRQVERYLTQRNIDFEVLDVLSDASALATLEERGYLGTPVTRVGDTWISGFRRAALERALATLPDHEVA
jgi:glutaredoxin